MRKQNAELKTAFTSEANKNLKNTDYFGMVELDQFACYVIADGIDDHIDAMGAKLAIHTIISKFSEAPGIKKRTLAACLKEANKALLQAKSKMKLKVSILMVVTDYVKLRYGQAGNTRLRLYRNGSFKESSIDHSVSMDLVLKKQMEPDKVAKHEERNNLHTYLGQKKGFQPFVSKKIKLMNGDMLTLYTRGIWEQVDEGELLDVFSEATTEPQETVDLVEDLLLSKQPKELDKYTFAVIFINKLYVVPDKKRKIKHFLMTAIPIAVLVGTIALILLIRHNKKVANIEAMNQGYLNTIEYIQSDNYIRAKEEVTTAKELAEKVKDKSMQAELDNYLKLVESVISADEALAAKKYEDAQQLYQNALNRARYADNMARDYISERLEKSANYLSFYDLLSLGDTLALNLQYDKAEEKYLQAKALAGKIYFDEGRTAAIAALEKLYEDQKKQQEEKDEAIQQSVADQTAGANQVGLGDTAFAEGDYESAKAYYMAALQKYKELNAEIEAQAVEEKISVTEKKLEENAEKEEEAKGYLQQAEDSIAEKEYIVAKKYYLFAKDIYASMKKEDKVAEITRKMELLDLEQELQEQREEEQRQQEEQRRIEEEQAKQEAMQQETETNEETTGENSEGETEGENITEPNTEPVSIQESNELTPS